MTGTPLIEVEDLRIDLDDGSRRMPAAEGVSFRIDRGGTMTKEIEIDRPSRLFSEVPHRRRYLIRRQHRAWHGPEAAGVSDGNCQLHVA